MIGKFLLHAHHIWKYQRIEDKADQNEPLDGVFIAVPDGPKQVTIYCFRFDFKESKLAKQDAGRSKLIAPSLESKDGISYVVSLASCDCGKDDSVGAMHATRLWRGRTNCSFA